ncbi:PF07608 family protein [Caballeronia peredens]|nr:PF07608 family protein [Caballeronia peredens]
MPRARYRWAPDLRFACASLCAYVAFAGGPALAQTPADEPAKAASETQGIGALSAAQQAQWLSKAAASGALAKLDDAQIVALFRSLDPGTLPRYLQEGLSGYASYEFTMWRRERIKGKWPKRADHMLVRVTREPLRIYAKWLPDGAHAGQEVIYDDSKRPDELYGHLGGFLGVVPMWASVNGALARAQSNHSIRELGIEAMTQHFIDEGHKFAEAGITKPTDVDVKIVHGMRVVLITYETPTGQPEFYAKKEVLGLDLERPLIRTLESFDNDGNIFESVAFERIEPKPFDDLTFDPKNPDYRF